MSENLEYENNINTSEMAEPNNEIKKASPKVLIFNFALIFAIFIGLFIYMVNVDGLDNMKALISSLDYGWVALGCVCLVGVWLCEAITLHLPLKKMYPNQTFANSIKVAMIGQLFNNITPFSSGGQPMQAYELTKTGKRISDSLSAMAMKFIITQVALIVFTLLVVIFQFGFFIDLFKDYIWIVIVGFIINIIAIVVVVLMGTKKRAITMVTTPCIRWISKIHIGKFKVIRDADRTIEKLDESIENFNNQFKTMKAHKSMVVKIFITSFIQSLLYYSITYMVYRAFGNSGTGFFQIITVQAFLLLIMTFIPTPGSGLGAEGGFLLLFSSIFSKGSINMSILFWRVYTFYLPIVVGALFLIPSRKNKKG